jgi:hypothetical protein
MKRVLGSLIGLLALSTPAFALECQPTEVPVKVKVDITDASGGIVVNGSLGCAQSSTPDGKVRVLVTRVNLSESGYASSTVIEIQALPSEISGR